MRNITQFRISPGQLEKAGKIIVALGTAVKAIGSAWKQLKNR